ncbi:unnamed protein product [Mytilus coruscus]|uniref:Uncharacterized protein n=1 Tax=Mytilus coruscus TaxID=42192 RepID=A0A6J8EW20_MYTCO|nr:unnamed protein product [Mytilus coruscus]
MTGNKNTANSMNVSLGQNTDHFSKEDTRLTADCTGHVCSKGLEKEEMFENICQPNKRLEARKKKGKKRKNKTREMTGNKNTANSMNVSLGQNTDHFSKEDTRLTADCTGHVCSKGLEKEEMFENICQVCDKGLKSVEKSETFQVSGNRLKSYEKSDTTCQVRVKRPRAVQKCIQKSYWEYIESIILPPQDETNFGTMKKKHLEWHSLSNRRKDSRCLTKVNLAELCFKEWTRICIALVKVLIIMIIDCYSNLDRNIAGTTIQSLLF